jgi:hypothetical protein
MKNIDLTKNLDNEKIDDKNSKIPKHKKIDIYEFEDVQGGMTTKKLDVGLWFVKSKKTFIKIFIVFLIIISAISWSYSIYHFAYYIAKGMQEDQQLLNDMIDTNIISHSYLVQISAKNLSASSVFVFPLGDNKYDFLIELKNPNDAYWADFYNDTENIICGTSFLMPNENKNIIELAKEINSGSKSVNFTIGKLSWRRLDLHKYPNWENFKNTHMNISIENSDFKSIVQSGLSDKLGYNSLTFTAHNKTPYNYWEVDFNIILKRSGKMISINKYNLQEFISGETKNLEINWPGKLSSISDISITPIINILNNNNYIDFEGDPTLEK